MEGLFVTGNVNMAIGHHKNTEVMQSVCNKLGLAPPMGNQTYKVVDFPLLTSLFTYLCDFPLNRAFPYCFETSRYTSISDIDAIVSQCRSYSSVIPSVPGVGTHDTCCLFYSSGTTGNPLTVF